MKVFLLLTAICCFATAHVVRAGSATWSGHPSSGDWNTAANWLPNTVPNAESDIATFGVSSITTPTITNTTIDLDRAVFNSGAPPYAVTVQTTVSAAVAQLNLRGAGIINNSGVMQSFVFPGLAFSPTGLGFYNSASAGEMTTFGIVANGYVVFNDSSSAGSATFNVVGGVADGNLLEFTDDATAASATINVNFSTAICSGSSHGGNATINVTNGAYLELNTNANLEHANVNCDEAYAVLIRGSANAGDGTYTVKPESATTGYLNTILVDDNASAGNATFIMDGSMGAGLFTTWLTFYNNSTAANASITANGGSNGGPGAAIEFHNYADGGTASVALLGNSTLDISKHYAPPTTLGSLSGSGTVYLGARSLALGSNNASTTFAGVIQDTGGIGQNTGGSLSKVGTGTLILIGTNLYTGGTTVSAGVLRAANQGGSATGPGAVNVTGGVLGGKGAIAGAVTLGTGSGKGAILQPSVGVSQPVTLTIQSPLTFQADSTYTCKLITQKAKADQVVANGVTIASGAQFNFTALANKRLAAGTVFSAISNIAATPIAGTFANLADGSILTAGPNSLKVSYTGGDGNDLTLTVQ